MRLLLGITLLLCCQAQFAHAARVALLVGNNRADGTRSKLLYAQRDARSLQRVLEGLGGVDRSRLLLDQNAESLREALRELESSLKSNEPTTLFFYYSGHADERALLMNDTRMRFDELRATLRRMVEGAKVQLFVAIVDACQSGALARTKGGTTVSVVDIERAPGGYHGGVFITSSAAGEAAQESDELQASFFTHYLISGLRGAADASNDRRVSLEEAYRYAYQSTLQRTQGTLHGPQHPTYAVDISGQGQLVLTWLSSEKSYLRLPFSAEGSYALYNTERDLMTEVKKRAGQLLLVALEPGTYKVSIARGGFELWQSIEIRPGVETMLDASKMKSRPLQSYAMKGRKAQTHSLSLGYALNSGWLNDAGLSHGISFGYALQLAELGPLQLSLGAVMKYLEARYTAQDVMDDVRLIQLLGGLRAQLRWPLSYASPFVGLELLGGWTHQRLDVTEQRDHGSVFPMIGVLGVELALADPISLVVSGQLGAVAYREHAIKARMYAGVDLGLRLSF